MKRLILLLSALLFAVNISSAQEPETYGGLNEIRFANWTDDDWLDNDYIRELRNYIDACYNGEVDDPELEVFHDLLPSKFVIGLIEPAIYGGVFIHFMFVDMPCYIFYTQVYSYVDEDTKEVTSYEVRPVMLDDAEWDMTRDEMLEFLEEHPEVKVW